MASKTEERSARHSKRRKGVKRSRPNKGKKGSGRGTLNRREVSESYDRMVKKWDRMKDKEEEKEQELKIREKKEG